MQVPVNDRCACLSNLWIKRRLFGECSECGLPQYERPPNHIVVEWDIGSDHVCDFTFAIGPIVLKTEIADELLAHFAGFVKGEVRMIDHPNLRRPKKITKRTAKCVWLPYEGPPLCFMRMVKEVDFHTSSTVEIESNCQKCKKLIYKEFHGIEEKDSVRHVRREPGKGFYFHKHAVNGADFFRPKHTGFTLCTDKAKNFIEKRGYGNIEFLEVGNIVTEKRAPKKKT
jgi:hypothetical protein